MNKNVSKLIDKLMQSSESKVSLKALEKLFNTGIPFNIPHKFEFLELSHRKTLLKLPDIRKNKNHLGGMHACAIATLGEYPAGLTLVKKFGSTRYRLVMDRLQVEYFKQAREAVIGEVIVNHKELDEMAMLLKREDKAKITLATNILDSKEEVIAVVHTTWQMKNWDKVSFK